MKTYRTNVVDRDCKISEWPEGEFATEYDLLTRAADAEDARKRFEAWHAVAIAEVELDRLSGHIACTPECSCPDWIREAKTRLDELHDTILDLPDRRPVS